MNTQADKLRESAKIGEISGLLEQIQMQLARKGRKVATHRLENWQKIRSLANEQVARLELVPEEESALPIKVAE